MTNVLVTIFIDGQFEIEAQIPDEHTNAVKDAVALALVPFLDTEGRNVRVNANGSVSALPVMIDPLVPNWIP